MKEKIKSFLVKYPFLYRLFRNIYWKLQSLRTKILGTKLLEKVWQEKDFDLEKELNNLNYPHRQLLVEKISSFEPESILEIGCGYGPNLFLLKKKLPNAKIKGIDIRKNAVEEGKKFLNQNRIFNVELLVKKADELISFEDKSFDIVFTDATLMCIGPDKIKKIVEEIMRIAKKGIILIEWHMLNQKKDIYDAHIGVWKRDYLSLLKEFVPKEKIILSKITPELRPDKNWQKFGYIIEVKL